MSLLSLTAKVGDFFLPQRCLFCGSPGIHQGHVPVCEVCLCELVPISEPFCPRCGIPFETLDSHLCGDCLRTPPPFEWARSLFPFGGKAREFIHHLKFKRDLSTLTLLNYLLETKQPEFFAKGAIDRVVPVPQDTRGLRSRGYNPALLIALCLAKKMNKPVDRCHLIKIRKTLPQIGLTKKERHQNVKEAFAVKETSRFRGQTVLLVDDVYTTGATVSACTLALLKAGARTVQVWTFARTILE